VILVDTSVWVDHLRSGEAELVAVLEEGIVVTHPFVIGELACGNIANRTEVLGLVHDLSPAPVATHEEAMAFIEARSLMGRGLGYIDVHLLASSALGADVLLWSRDRRLVAVADELGLAYRG